MPVKPVDIYRRDLVGNGLIKPLRRASGNDFLSAHGESLVKASVMQILGTRPGELPWRPDFGCATEPYRHRGLTPDKAQFISDEIVQSLVTYDKRINVLGASTDLVDNKLTVTVTWTLQAAPGVGEVLVGPITQEVVI